MTSGPEIDDICARLNAGTLPLPRFVEAYVRLTSRQVGCSRAGLWAFVASPTGRRRRCLGLYDSTGDRMFRVDEESEDKVAPYFAELQRGGVVVANDVREHFATRGLFATQLQRNRVRSLMAAAFALNGKLIGAFTCTELEPGTHWSAQQLSILRFIGSRATLAMAAAAPAPLDSVWASL